MTACCGDGGVENFVGEEHLGAGFCQGRGVEVEEAKQVGEDRQVRHEGEERDQPDDVPGVVGREEEHQGRGQGEGGRKEGRLSLGAGVGSAAICQHHQRIAVKMAAQKT